MPIFNLDNQDERNEYAKSDAEKAQPFNIKKRGNYFVAFDRINPKRSFGKINIITGKFEGDTCCLIELNNYWDEVQFPIQEAFYDKVLATIKDEINSDDVTALDGLLRVIPRKLLEDYLPEEL